MLKHAMTRGIASEFKRVLCGMAKFRALMTYLRGSESLETGQTQEDPWN